MADLYLRFKLLVEVDDNEIQPCIYAHGHWKDFEAQALAKKQFSFQVFFLMQLSHRHYLATLAFILDI